MLTIDSTVVVALVSLNEGFPHPHSRFAFLYNQSLTLSIIDAYASKFDSVQSTRIEHSNANAPPVKVMKHATPRGGGRP